jgi:plasmid stabilization system protein ParE
MAQVTWQDIAVDDLEEVLGHYAEKSLAYAEKLHTQVIVKARMLVDSPKMGRIVPEFENERIRELIVPPLRVIYVVASDVSCTIARIIHSSRDLVAWVDPEDLLNNNE